MSELKAIMKGKDKRKQAGEKKDDDYEDNGEEASGEVTAEKSDYDYLLGMNLWSLTFEKVEQIKKELKEKEHREMKKKTVEQFWDADLDALSAKLDELDH